MEHAQPQITTFVRADRLRLASFFTARHARREYLRGVLIEPTPEGAALVGTDGHKLGAFQDFEGFTLVERVVILPQRAVNAIETLTRSGYQSWFAIIDGIGAERAVGVIVTDPGVGGWIAVSQPILDMTGPDVQWIGQVELIPPQDIRWRAMLSLPATPGLKPVTAFGADIAPFLAVAKQGQSTVTIVGDGSTPYLVDCGRPDFVGVISPVLFQKMASLSEADVGFLAPAWARPLGDVELDACPSPASAVSGPIEREAA